MPDELAFQPDLYRGLADDYDRYRPGYPAALTDWLATLAPAGQTGRLLDVACGTGHLTFALADRFAETWAVDAEPDMIRVVTGKAADRVRPVLAAAEQLDAPAASFDLITIGTAFHRLPRTEVARRCLGWLRPGSQLALCWSDLPWQDDGGWQRAYLAVLQRWFELLGTTDRVPADWSDRRPHTEILAEAGFELAGRTEFAEQRSWTPAELAGQAYSTTLLPRSVLGSRRPEFEAELAVALGPFVIDGRVQGTVSSAIDLARRPA